MAEGVCVKCKGFFTVDNPKACDLPVRIKYPGGEEALPVTRENKGPICRKCLDHVIDATRGANEATGISFVGKDAHLNDPGGQDV